MADQHEKLLTGEAIASLTQRLGLRRELVASQDWELLAASGERLREFVEYYDSEPKLSSDERFALMSLIVASLDQAMLEGSADAELVERIRRLLTAELGAFTPLVRYWSLVERPDLEGGFAVTPLMREILDLPQN